MEYDFFFSYTRANNGDYLKKLFNDVSEEIRERRGLPAGTLVGFFDQRDIELGEQWEESIAEALQASKIMVCVYSPGYFKSPYCGKEWQIFQMRRRRWVDLQQRGGAKDAVLPPVIKPIMWIPTIPANLDPAVAASQYLTGDPYALHNAEGVKYMLQKLQDYQSLYVDYVKKLALEIVQAADQYRLPLLPGLPALSTVDSAFTMIAPAVPAVAGPRASVNPKHVRFVFVAADPNRFGQLRSADPYVDNGGGDWKPFFPADSGSIGPALQHVVSDRDLGLSSDEIPFGRGLKQEIEAALEERKIVIILVDAWTLAWDADCRSVLKEIDQKIYYHCCVLVPWNELDADTVQKRTEVEQAIKETFDLHINFVRNPILYRDSITSVEELCDIVRDVVIRLRAEVRHRTPARSAAPVAIQKPVIAGPGH